ncbi:MAG: sulfate adenylyltransferase subunit 1, partial [Flavobacteriales bacterium]
QIPDDKLLAIEKSSAKRGLDFVDLSLLTDGLIAERAQGITIDVAHIYFNTPSRKYIIADTPGHVEYTRNMITGASTTDAAIVLIDARKGILEQTKRHVFIAHLLQLKHMVVTVNKMDLVDFKESVFNSICTEFNSLRKSIGFNGEVHFLPISALKGEGVTQFMGYQPWFKGSSLLDVLESIPTKSETSNATRFQVQHVLRPKSEEYPDYRGYAGNMLVGEVKVGHSVVNTRTAQEAKVLRLEKWSQEIDHAEKDLALTVHLDKDIDVRRGDFLSGHSEAPTMRKSINAHICWLNDAPLNLQTTYLLQQGSSETKCKIKAISKVMNLKNLSWEQPEEVLSNSIAKAEIQCASPVLADPYNAGNKTGAFILIHPHTKLTVAAGFCL